MEPDQRMNPTGYEETELTYNVPEETVSAPPDQEQKVGGFEDGIDTECGLDDQPLPGPSRRNTGTVYDPQGCLEMALLMDNNCFLFGENTISLLTLQC